MRLLSGFSLATFGGVGQPSLEGPWGKLNRANEHLEALDREVDGLVKLDTYAIRGEFETDRTEYVMRCHVTSEPPLQRLGLIFGDAIQNLRTALDHLLCQLIIASGGKVAQQQFPIFTYDPAGNKRACARWKRQTLGLGPPYLEAVKNVQPYQAKEAPERRPLAVLAELSNADKHRIVLPAITTIDEAIADTLRPVPHDLDIVGLARVRVGRALEEGTEVLRMPIRVTGPDPHMEVNGHIPLYVAFGNPPVPPSGVQMLSKHVRGLLQAFEKLLNS